MNSPLSMGLSPPAQPGSGGDFKCKIPAIVSLGLTGGSATCRMQLGLLEAGEA